MLALETNKRLKILIGGRVQGVFFRAAAKRVADEYGVAGYAKNLPDGMVQIIAEGSIPALRKLLDWCYRGSVLAHVDSLSFDWLPASAEYERFNVIMDEGGFVSDKIHALTNLGRRVLNRVDHKMDKTVVVKSQTSSVPKHVVIIPDGNRRWAREKGLETWQGHQEGIKRAKELIKVAEKHGITHLTLWGFSTENWSRSKEEVDWLMNAFARSIKEFGVDLIKSKVGFKHFGRKDRLNNTLISGIRYLEHKTAQFTERKFAMALDYGGRDEIMRAAKKASENGGVSEGNIAKELDTAGFPDPDLIIRTSGEQRTSGVMPWQSVYSELYFSPVHFPDFSEVEFGYALEEYTARNRRFGGS
ncbi:MAG TPA: polyprenyl diphosphate synthase [Candidatus Paceibacterota bacterium]